MALAFGLQAGLFVADGARDLLGIFDEPLADVDLFGFNRPLLEADVLFAKRDSDGLAFADRTIGGLTLNPAALDFDFVMPDRYLNRARLGDYLLADLDLADVGHLRVGAELLFAQGEAGLGLEGGRGGRAARGPSGGWLVAGVNVVGAEATEDGLGLSVATVSLDRNDSAAGLELLVVIACLVFRDAHPSQSAEQAASHRADQAAAKDASQESTSQDRANAGDQAGCERPKQDSDNAARDGASGRPGTALGTDRVDRYAAGFGTAAYGKAD